MRPSDPRVRLTQFMETIRKIMLKPMMSEGQVARISYPGASLERPYRRGERQAAGESKRGGTPKNRTALRSTIFLLFVIYFFRKRAPMSSQPQNRRCG